MKTLIVLVLILGSTSVVGVQAVREHKNKVAAKINPAARVENMIEVLTEESRPEFKAYAQSIQKWSDHYQIDSRFVVALIMTESSFNQDAVSATGDLGLGQVNPKVWRKEFKRINGEKLDTKKLATDFDYNIQKTVQILSFMKNHKDVRWVGKYHSKTPSLKQAYYGRIFHKLTKIANAQSKSRTIASVP